MTIEKPTRRIVGSTATTQCALCGDWGSIWSEHYRPDSDYPHLIRVDNWTPVAAYEFESVNPRCKNTRECKARQEKRSTT